MRHARHRRPHIGNDVDDRTAEACSESARAGGTSGLGRLRLFKRAYVELIETDFGRCLLALRRLPVRASTRTRIAMEYRRVDTLVRVLIAEGIADGSIRECDVRMITFALLGAMIWVPNWFKADGTMSAAQAGDALFEVFHVGLRPRKAALSSAATSCARAVSEPAMTDAPAAHATRNELHEPSLRVEGLRKRFDGKPALEGLSFTLGRGEVLGLLGPNGAGKTTTFLCLCGLLRPDAGTIVYDGKLLGGDRGRAISLIPETPDVYPMLTVWEHLAFVARSARLERDWERRAEELLELFGMLERRDALGQTLSKGMRQKTLIAATVLAGTPVLLFDEPLIGLDPRGQRELRGLIRSLSAAGTSIVMSTHMIESAESLCDRLIIMKAGVVVASGAVSELRSLASDGRTLEDVFLDITA